MTDEDLLAFVKDRIGGDFVLDILKFEVITGIHDPAVPFELGEILIVSGLYERENEFFGPRGRKPSKWDTTLSYELFPRFVDAKARSDEVLEGKH